MQKRVADHGRLGDLVPMLGKGPQGSRRPSRTPAARSSRSRRRCRPRRPLQRATNRFNQSWTNLKNDIGPSVIDPLSHAIDKLDEG